MGELRKKIEFLVCKTRTFNVVYFAHNEANYKNLLFNKVVQQTSCHQRGLINLSLNTQVVLADNKLLCLPWIRLGHICTTRSVCGVTLCCV